MPRASPQPSTRSRRPTRRSPRTSRPRAGDAVRRGGRRRKSRACARQRSRGRSSSPTHRGHVAPGVSETMRSTCVNRPNCHDAPVERGDGGGGNSRGGALTGTGEGSASGAGDDFARVADQEVGVQHQRSGSRERGITRTARITPACRRPDADDAGELPLQADGPARG